MHPELRETNRLLERVAQALEMIVLRQWGIRMGHCAERVPDANPNERPGVDYETDSSALKRELIDVAKHRDPGRVIDDEEEFGL